jgi:Pyruvate/2-oxoacid:ferredoxin oxidoreductase delta subunit
MMGVPEWKFKRSSICEGYSYETWELFLKFPNSEWNKKDYRPIVSIMFSGRTSKWQWSNRIKPYKRCSIKFQYIQNCPEVALFKQMDSVDYESFDVEYCKQRAIILLRERLNAMLSQLDNVYNPRR